jgi:hypothetical protein
MGMTQSRSRSRSLLGVAAGFLLAGLLFAGSGGIAPARADNAADLCTPDVMRLCSDYIPDRNRIVRCLRAKRRHLSPGCRQVMAPSKKKHRSKRGRHHRRRG